MQSDRYDVKQLTRGDGVRSFRGCGVPTNLTGAEVQPASQRDIVQSQSEGELSDDEIEFGMPLLRCVTAKDSTEPRRLCEGYDVGVMDAQLLLEFSQQLQNPMCGRALPTVGPSYEQPSSIVQLPLQQVECLSPRITSS